MGFTWGKSADKHEIDPEDGIHAMLNAIHVEILEPRGPNPIPPKLYIGPPRQMGGPLLEVMVWVEEPDTVYVFHAMEARQKILDRMKK